jgi:hypothetical protein
MRKVLRMTNEATFIVLVSFVGKLFPCRFFFFWFGLLEIYKIKFFRIFRIKRKYQIKFLSLDSGEPFFLFWRYSCHIEARNHTGNIKNIF